MHNALPKHIASLDGLRAFAILAVIFHHAGEYFLLREPNPSEILTYVVENGGRGVELFFALSGFLITGILLDTRERNDYFGRFYWRRALRIWPLYYGFLFAVLLFHSKTFRGLGFAPFALYYRNFLGPDPISDFTLGHFWSLCVEEQFYLIWPIVICFCAKRFQLPLVIVLMATALLIRLHFVHSGLDSYILMRLPFCRMDSLLSGAAVAILVRRRSLRFVRNVSWFATISGLTAIALCSLPGASSQRFLLIGSTGSSLLFGGIVGLCVTGLRRLTSKVLGSSFLGAISTRSYAMYVFHLVPLWGTVLLLAHWNRMPQKRVSGYGLIAAIMLVTYALSWLSWRFFEQPILRLKDYRFH
jgi:peptidoglycan/LPS O-acetylase OafA/YrhL